MKNKKSQLTKGILFGAALSLLALIIFTGCPSQQSMLDNRDAASKVYVAPGENDDYNAFLSGGFSGQMSVWGLPSARYLKTISLFSQNPETGFAYNNETGPLRNISYGYIQWNDSNNHHYT